jgi:hypothetical protein
MAIVKTNDAKMAEIYNSDDRLLKVCGFYLNNKVLCDFIHNIYIKEM